MRRYIIKRVLLMIPIILGVSFIIYFILWLTPGDPASLILDAGVTQEQIDALNHELGYDQPFFQQYSTYMYKAIFKFDLGNSYRYKVPVLSKLMMAFPISVMLAFIGVGMAAMIGIPIGILSAVKQYRLLDTIPTTIALFIAAVPTFWLGMMLLLIFALQLGWLPSHGMTSWKNWILPVLAIALPYAAREMRFTRSSLLEIIRQDYIVTARAKGASERSVIWKHALKNALLPVITSLGSDFSGLIGGAITIEALFSIPGLGSMVVTAIKQKDIPIVMGGSMFLAIIFSIVVLLTDLIYAVIDPRIKAKYTTVKKGGH